MSYSRYEIILEILGRSYLLNGNRFNGFELEWGKFCPGKSVSFTLILEVNNTFLSRPAVVQILYKHQISLN